jgi:hypothetical protein
MRLNSNVFLVSCIVVSLYVLFSLKYYYKYTPRIEIMQCDTKTFQQQLLAERNPLVCRGLLELHAFQMAKKHVLLPLQTQSALHCEQKVSDALYTAVRIETPFCRKAEVLCFQTTASSENHFRRGWHAVWFIFQLHGTQRLALYSPEQCEDMQHRPSTTQPHQTRLTPDASDHHTFIELILHEGDGVFVPTAWGVQPPPPTPSSSSTGITGEMCWNPSVIPSKAHQALWKIVRRCSVINSPRGK